ncbi:MAG: helix-turn-helix domain-containing protein [Bacteroidota bacterium]
MQSRAFSYVPINQVCTELGISRTRVYQLIKEHNISLMKLGKKSLLSVEDVEALITDRSSEEA